MKRIIYSFKMYQKKIMFLHFLLSISIKILILIGSYEMVMNKIQWKKALFVFILVEAFWLSSFVLHEFVHSVLFHLQSGSFGIIHFFDQVSFSYGTIAVTIPPNTTLFDSTFHELCAYSAQVIATALFAIIMWLRFYSHKHSYSMT